MFFMGPIIQLFMNPAILSLLVGVLLGTYSSLSLPRKFLDFVSVYLIFAIGFKGGFSFILDGLSNGTMLTLFAVGVLIGFVQPFINYAILNKSTTLDRPNLAALATQYGSISIVTFITGLKFLAERNISYEPYMLAFAGLMEIPALFSGLWILKHDNQKGNEGLFQTLADIFKSVLSCKKVLFIFVGFAAGLLANKLGLPVARTLVFWPFDAALVLFMVDIGMKIANQREHIHHISSALLAFGIYMPILSGILALLISAKLGLTIGSALLFALLLASASYIAVPAVMRTQTTKAKEVIYLPMALGVTLPFNILIGIPLFYYLAKVILNI